MGIRTALSARDSELVQKMERMGGGPLASSINIYAGKGLDAAIADSRNTDLAPWQRAFAAAAYNALHAGLASGALRGDCYGSGQICPSDSGSTTPSDVLLETGGDHSSTNFDTQVAAAAAVVFLAWPESARLGRQMAGKEAASLFDKSGRLRPEVIRGAFQIVPGEKLGNPAVVRTLTADGSAIANWGKYSSGTFNSPSGRIEVHFYMNSQTGAVNYGIDYKVVFPVGVAPRGNR